MPFTEPPPTGAEFAVPVYEADGTTIKAIEISPVWQQWFATFQEGIEGGIVGMGLSLSELQSELATLTQDNVDSIGAAIFGDDYKGKWVARTHNVGNVRSYDGKYYKCIVARTAANIVEPDSDTTGWELIGSAPDLESLSDDNINAIGGAAFGANYQGTWEAGIFVTESVVYHDGFFYECTVSRTAANTDDPSVDAGSWAITSTTDESGDVSQAVQAAIDGSARIEYGASYKEEWSAGVYAVGDVVYHDGVFYECDVARAAADTDNPATDTASWSPKASSEGGITQAVQNAIDAQAAINFGDDYKGAWAAGVFVVGDVVYFGGIFYECDVARAAAHTDDPATDAASWSVKTVTFELMGDVAVDLSSVTNAIQNAIDAQGTANFGDEYKGPWSAGVYAVDDVSYHDGAFYTCTVARAASDTDNPAVDTASWAIEVAESGGLDTAIQNAIDAQGAIQFGSDYRGAWEAGAFAVGDVVYHDGVFYECDVIRTAANTNNPAVNTPAWSVKTVDVANVDISGLSADVQNAINAQATSAFGDQYKGVWAAGAYAVGEVVYHSGAFYTCDVTRAATDTDNPADTASWSVKAAEAGGLSQAVQNAIDAQGAIQFGDDYKGAWAVGIFAVGDVVYHDGQFYICTQNRTAANMNNPSVFRGPGMLRRRKPPI